MVFDSLFPENISLIQEHLRIQTLFYLFHGAKLVFRIKRFQKAGFQLADAVLCRNCAAHLDDRFGPGLKQRFAAAILSHIMGNQIDMYMVIANVSEDSGLKSARLNPFPVQGEYVFQM